MRILEVNKFYYERRGAERHFLDVIRLFRDAGHEVSVFTMNDPRNVSREYEKYFVSPVGYNRGDSSLWQRMKGIGRLFWSFEARRKMRWMLDDFRPDVVHVHNAYHQLSLSILPVIRSRGIPIIMTVHDYHLVSPDKDAYSESVGDRYWKFLFVKKYGFGKRFLLVLKSYWERFLGFQGMIERYIVPSEYVKNILARAGIDGGRIVVIPHFVFSDTLDFSSAYPKLNSEPYALYFGGVTEEKGIAELVSVFNYLRFPLLLAGKKDMDISERNSVRYVGEQTREQLGALIRKASFVVSASRLPETFGLIALEANAQGKPFFGYATGAFPEIIENGENGWLAEDTESFRTTLSEFIRGNRAVSDADTIRHKTFACFGSEQYLERFIRCAELAIRSHRVGG